jgi:DNA-directed RNA polymerase subunit RPC12/RpoP
VNNAENSHRHRAPAGTTTRTRYVPVFTIDPEIGRMFVSTLCGRDALQGEIVLEDTTVYLEVIAGEAANTAAIKESLRRADAAVLLVRFIDALSISQIREIYQTLPLEPFLPRAIFVFRQKGEVEFKMSCSNCSQKLWVRDADAGRAGRCPHCKKTFLLPKQADNVRGLLDLPKDLEVSYTSQGNVQTCSHALSELINKIFNHEAASKAKTMRIQIPAEDTPSGAQP